MSLLGSVRKLFFATIILSCLAFLTLVELLQPSTIRHKMEKATVEIETGGRALQPVKNLHYRGDKNSSEAIRKSVTVAMDDIDRLSCGLVHIDVQWNFDPKYYVGAAIYGDDTIISLNSLQIASVLGREDEDTLLGMTRKNLTSKSHPMNSLYPSSRKQKLWAPMTQKAACFPPPPLIGEENMPKSWGFGRKRSSSSKKTQSAGITAMNSAPGRTLRT